MNEPVTEWERGTNFLFPDAQDQVHLPPLSSKTYAVREEREMGWRCNLSLSCLLSRLLSLQKKRRDVSCEKRNGREKGSFMLVIHTKREKCIFFNINPPLETGWELNYVYKLKTIALSARREIKDSEKGRKRRCKDGNRERDKRSGLLKKRWLWEEKDFCMSLSWASFNAGKEKKESKKKTTWKTGQDWWEEVRTDDVRLGRNDSREGKSFWGIHSSLVVVMEVKGKLCFVLRTFLSVSSFSHGL